jgi:hypothetical protein
LRSVDIEEIGALETIFLGRQRFEFLVGESQFRTLVHTHTQRERERERERESHAPILGYKGNVSLSAKNHLKGSVHLKHIDCTTYYIISV